MAKQRVGRRAKIRKRGTDVFQDMGKTILVKNMLGEEYFMHTDHAGVFSHLQQWLPHFHLGSVQSISMRSYKK